VVEPGKNNIGNLFIPQAFTDCRDIALVISDAEFESEAEHLIDQFDLQVHVLFIIFELL